MIAFSNYLSDSRIIRQAQSAIRSGYKVDFITPRKPGEKKQEIIQGVNLYRLDVYRYKGNSIFKQIFSYFNFFIRCTILLFGMHIKNNYRIIHINNIPDFLVFSTVIPKALGAKVILDIHDPMPETYLAKYNKSKRGFFYNFLRIQERLSAAYSTSVITVSEPIKRDILCQNRIDQDKITVVANFADAELFPLVSHFSLSSPIRLVYHGTIAERFGFKDSLEAISNLKSQNAIFLKIIGEGDYEGNLREIIRKQGLSKIVDFENKVYPNVQLANILCRYHLGFAPYLSCPATDYMLPVKMMELLAMGIPVITISNTAISYYLDDRMYFAYDPNNINSLTDLLQHIVEDPALIIQKRECILANRTNFLWKNESIKYSNLLKCLTT